MAGIPALFFTYALGRMKGVRSVVFTATCGDVARSFLGVAEAVQVLRALAAAQPWLRLARMQAGVQQVGVMPTGGFSPQPPPGAAAAGCYGSADQTGSSPPRLQVLAAVAAAGWQDRMVASLFSSPVIITYVDPDNVQLAQSTDNRLLPRVGENVRLGRTPYVVERIGYDIPADTVERVWIVCRPA